MYSNKKKSIALWGVSVILFYLLSFPLNTLLSSAMQLHQLVQLPGMIVIGVLIGYAFPKVYVTEEEYGISALIFIMTSFIFWMLPRSVDLAAIRPIINRIMQVNMVFAGFLCVVVFRKLHFKIKIVFLEMLSAMLIAVGMTLHSFNRLLCSSFNIQEQKETGFYFLLIGAALFPSTLIYFFAALEHAGD